MVSLSYNWLFDENFSALLLGDYDLDENLFLNQQELTTLATETMEGAFALEYFTHIYVGDTRVFPNMAQKVLATYQDNRLTLSFILNLPEPIILSENFQYNLYDQEYYTAFIVENKTDYRISGQGSANCLMHMVEAKMVDNNLENALENAFSQDVTNQGLGAQFADHITISCS